MQIVVCSISASILPSVLNLILVNPGYAILASESNNYCSNSTFTSDLSACLDCALTYDIWQYYGDQVAAAAEACGDNATPSASSTSASPSSTGSVASSTAVTGAVSTTASSSSGSASIAAVPTSVSQTSASNSVCVFISSMSGEWYDTNMI